jgi:hypothetical protein
MKKTKNKTKSSDVPRALSDKEYKKMIKETDANHAVWHKFYNFISRAYGKDLYGKWQVMKIQNKDTGKKSYYKYRDFNEYELSKRLVGYEVMKKIDKYVQKNPQIKRIPCDDSMYAGSDILLIPHIRHGITMIFIPQCTSIQNQMFLYQGHYKNFMKELKNMSYVYKNSF